MWYVYQENTSGIDNEPELIGEFETLDECFEFDKQQNIESYKCLKDDPEYADIILPFEQFKNVSQEVAQSNTFEGFSKYSKPRENTEYKLVFMSHLEDGYSNLTYATKNKIK